MGALLLAALLALPAAAQRRGAAVEAAASESAGAGSRARAGLGALQPLPLSGGPVALVPSLTPPLSPALAPMLPAPLAAGRPDAARARPLPAALAAPAAPLPAAPPESAKAAGAEGGQERAAAGDQERAAAGAAAALTQAAGEEDTSLAELADQARQVFGESAGPGELSAEYLRPGESMGFSEGAARAYESARAAFRSSPGPGTNAALVSAAADLMASAGVAAEAGERAAFSGGVQAVLKILPRLDGPPLNRLAYDLQRKLGSGMEYAPLRTLGGVAAYSSGGRVLFLPDFSRQESFEAILHEARHAAFAKRMAAGDLSAFHPALVAYRGRAIAPGAQSYDSYMSLEEVSTHAKTLLHAALRAKRGGSREEAAEAGRRYAYQMLDVLRTTEINLTQLRRRLEEGAVETERLSDSSWQSFPGGHWESLRLPHAILVLPVPEEAPAPKRSALARLLQGRLPTPGEKAARRHLEALQPLLGPAARQVEAYLAALGAGDVEAAAAAASRLTALAAAADRRFAASR